MGASKRKMHPVSLDRSQTAPIWERSKDTGCIFLLDAPIQPGSSGSAVYLRENGIAAGIATGPFLAPVETEQEPAANIEKIVGLEGFEPPTHGLGNLFQQNC